MHSHGSGHGKHIETLLDTSIANQQQEGMLVASGALKGGSIWLVVEFINNHQRLHHQSIKDYASNKVRLQVLPNSPASEVERQHSCREQQQQAHHFKHFPGMCNASCPKGILRNSVLVELKTNWKQRQIYHTSMDVMTVLFYCDVPWRAYVKALHRWEPLTRHAKSESIIFSLLFHVDQRKLFGPFLKANALPTHSLHNSSCI